MLNLDVVNRAELDLMACLLVEPHKTIKEIRGVVSASDFLNPASRSVYEAVLALADSGKTIDPTLTLAHAAQQGNGIEETYAAAAMQHYTTTANARVTAELVHKAALERAAAGVGEALASGELDTLTAVGKLQELIRGQGERLKTPLEVMHDFCDFAEAAASGESVPFVSTGYASLDRQLAGGFVKSGLIILAARPGTGKTTIALNLAEKVVERGGQVLYISLEMDSHQLSARRVAAYSGLGYSAVYRGALSEKEWARFNAATSILSARPFNVHDKPCSIDDVERAVRSCDGLSLVVIDHIGLIRNASGRSRYEAMTDTAHRLKQLALSTGIPILALCQLNRQNEQRNSKIPTVADLRDSGAIEEDADVVALLHRPAMYANEDTAPKPWEVQELQVIIGKNRHGMQGTVKLNFVGMTSKITEERRRED